ncbi:hypothetical protein U27_04126 [Candidatus Vecturithrix granuli]|uniref:O-antigen ligase-related domain-containing protein n=1 Tax=Vecturithrix granuli TaxID=1499967 RepID=A0A081BXV6_VECG1|nr:hypothetical protein U27_04126 [Candidatus Vecturithrix granuli]
MYAKIIEFGIFFLLIYSPLAFGGVAQHSVALIEVVSGLLVLVWLVGGGFHRRGSSISPFFPRTLWGILGVLLTWILIQFLPVPTVIVKYLSPSAYALYVEAAAQIHVPLPSFLPLSVCSYATKTEFYKFVAYAAIFLLVIHVVRTPRQVHRFIYLIITMGFLEAFYGLLQYLSGQHQIYSFQTTRWVHGTFVNQNHFAGYMELTIPLALGMLLTRFETPVFSRSDHPSFSSQNKYAKTIFLLAIVLLMVCALFLSGSRGGIFSFLCGMSGFLALIMIRRQLRRWGIMLLVFLGMVIIITLITNSPLIERRLRPLQELASNPSLHLRWELWRSALRIFQDYPIVGSGLGAYSHLGSRYRTFLSDLHFMYPENEYLQLLAETGLIGFTLFLLFGVIFFFRVVAIWRRRRSRWVIAIVAGGLSAMVSVLCHSATDFNLHIPSNALLFSVIAALIFVTIHLHAPEEKTILKDSHLPYHHQISVPQNLRGRYRRSLLLLFPLFYLWQVAVTYYAFHHYQRAQQIIQKSEDESLHSISANSIFFHLQQALQYDHNHPEYAYTLANVFYNASQIPQNSAEFRETALHEAEKWFREAILCDPANPWLYYQLGRLSHQRGDCSYWKNPFLREHPASCPPAQFFLHTLRNAPGNLYLRKEISRWFYNYDAEIGLRFIQALRTTRAQEKIANPYVIRQLAQFLYEMQMDDASDQEFAHFLKTRTQKCQFNILTQDLSDANILELGNDDGIPDWYAPLVSESERVKKEICLPESLDEYRYAALKVFMGTGGKRHFLTHLTIDDQHIATYTHTLPQQANWHEIPFDLTLLRGKSKINVYIRVEEASADGNFLRIGGDQQTPTTCSSLNFYQFGDLSSEKGNQYGEFLIRLVLKK